MYTFELFLHKLTLAQVVVLALLKNSSNFPLSPPKSLLINTSSITARKEQWDVVP